MAVPLHLHLRLGSCRGDAGLMEGFAPSVVTSSLFGRCPRCGTGPLFAGYLRVAPLCSHCALDYTVFDVGDGAAVFVILIVGFLVVGGALLVEIAWSPPYWVHA